ncbi:MAG: QueT transporter family protein [Clostridia bacterium]|nr:QueT transporter family protein [Clostridia bacterium]
MNKSVLVLIRCAVISALYFCLTTLLAPISFGAIQFRLAEAMCLLPMLFPEASVGLCIGCALANLSSPFGVWDVVVGSLVTLVAGFLTSKIKNVWLAGLPPILLNAFILPIIWSVMGVGELYILNVLSLLVSQSVVIYAGGIPLVKGLKKTMKI